MIMTPLSTASSFKFFRWWAAYFAHRKVPVRFTFINSLNKALECNSPLGEIILPTLAMPAQSKKTLISLNLLKASLNALFTSSSFVTSAEKNATCGPSSYWRAIPRSLLRSIIATLQPWARNSFVAANPRPEQPPVMIAAFPSRRINYY